MHPSLWRGLSGHCVPLTCDADRLPRSNTPFTEQPSELREAAMIAAWTETGDVSAWPYPRSDEVTDDLKSK